MMPPQPRQMPPQGGQPMMPPMPPQGGQPPVPPQGGPAAMRGTAIKGSELSPEHMEQLKVAWQHIHNVLYAENSRVLNEVIKAMGTNADIIQIVAGTIVMILDQLEQKIGEIDLALLFPLGMGILQEIRSAAKSAGAKEWQPEERKAIIKQAIAQWVQSHPNVDKAQLRQLMSQSLQGGQDTGGQGGMLAQVAGEAG